MSTGNKTTYVDRSDAVNLARNAIDHSIVDEITPTGVRTLCEAVLAMDAALIVARENEQTAAAIQWRNIKHVVRVAADHAFGSKNDPDYGHCWLAVVSSLTAKDGIGPVQLEPLTLQAEELPSRPQINRPTSRDVGRLICVL